jgi:hypothetical protein
MKKLDIKLGGHHLTGDDLLYVQSSLVEGLKAFVDMFGSTAAVLYGVEFSVAGPTLSWTAGWVYINGEICQMDAGSATLASNNTLVIVETYDSAGNQTYEDLNVEDTYVIRKATVSGTAGGANLYTNLSRLSLNAIGAWQSLNPIYGGSWAGLLIHTTSPGYRKNQMSEVVFKGTIGISGFATPADDVAFTLPSGYRPKDQITTYARCILNAVDTFIELNIDTNGDVSPIGLVASDNCQIHLYDVRIPTT